MFNILQKQQQKYTVNIFLFPIDFPFKKIERKYPNEEHTLEVSMKKKDLKNLFIIS